MSSHPVERLTHVGRALLLIHSVLALGTLLVWTLRPEWVERIDESFVQRHVGRQEERLDAARAQAQGDGRAAVGRYEELLANLAHVDAGDRLDGVVRAALEEVTELLQNLNEEERALDWYDTWMAFDERALTGRVARALLLQRIDGRDEEGLEELRTLHRMAPEVDFVTSAWCDALIRDGQLEEALRAAREHDRRPRSNAWKLHWSASQTGQDRRCLVTPRLLRDGALKIDFVIEDSLTSLRLYLPDDVALILGDPRLVLRDGATETVLRVVDGAGRAHRLSRVGSSFASDGSGEAYFEFELPGAPTAELDGTFTATFAPRASRVLARLALHPEPAAAFAARAGDELREARALLQEVRLSELSWQEFQLFWKRTSQSFVEKRSWRGAVDGRAVDGRFEFALAAPVEMGVKQLRLDFPEVRGISWHIERVELEEDGQATVFQPETLDVYRTVGVEHDGNVFRVVGPDPLLELQLPERALPATVGIRGWVE